MVDFDRLSESPDKFHKSIDAFSHVDAQKAFSLCSGRDYEESINPPNHNHVAAFSVEFTVSKLMNFEESLKTELEELVETNEEGHFKRLSLARGSDPVVKRAHALRYVCDASPSLTRFLHAFWHIINCLTYLRSTV